MKTILFIFSSFLSFGQVQDTLGPKVIATMGKVNTEMEVIDVCGCYDEASFNGGTAAMLEYISTHLIYPDCTTVDQQGRLYVSFTVELDGDLSDIRVYYAPCLEMETMIIALFDKMPPWKPASPNGVTPIKSNLRIPLQICYK